MGDDFSTRCQLVPGVPGHVYMQVALVLVESAEEDGAVSAHLTTSQMTAARQSQNGIDRSAANKNPLAFARGSSSAPVLGTVSTVCATPIVNATVSDRVEERPILQCWWR